SLLAVAGEGGVNSACSRRSSALSVSIRTASRKALRASSSPAVWHSRAPWRTISSSDASGGRRSNSNGFSLILVLLLFRLLRRAAPVLPHVSQQVAHVGVGRVPLQRLAVNRRPRLAPRLHEPLELDELRQRRPRRQLARLPLDEPPQVVHQRQ